MYTIHSIAAGWRSRLARTRLRSLATLAREVFGAAVLSAAIVPAAAQNAAKPSFPSMAPIAQYRMASRTEEIALARSAAPASISGDAEILVLGAHGYETAAKGKNGFVCLVERSWFASFSDPQFWNPRIRGPDCLNPAAASSVLPANLERTQWVLAGVSKADMLTRSGSSVVARQLPAAGAMGYMMSKDQHLSDTDGHWHPHLMFFQPHAALSTWGANLPGSPVLGQEGDEHETTILFVPLAKWSDGTAVSMDTR
jgi:hypothetical protein